jgi:histone deacetylase HOS3
MDVFIPYQPEGPSPVAVSQTEPLKWLPPNAPTSVAGTPVATPSPVKRHHNLFNQATGISFAPRPENKGVVKSEGFSGDGGEKTEEKEGSSMRSIPETPK